jgi:N6-L-threonylcarbamoyladenine synthase
MIILGIETSCDETSAAIVEGNGTIVRLRSNAVATSLALHAKTGGVIPEIAAREQLKYMLPVLQEAVEKGLIVESDLQLDQERSGPSNILAPAQKGTYAHDILDALQQIDAIAITYGPGLIGSLLVGVETARTLAYVLNKPLIPVNHMMGHIYANWLVADSTLEIEGSNNDLQTTSYEPRANIEFPAIALIVSGLHTDLLLLKRHGEYTLLGGTRDDAAGEAFDKIGRLLGFPYPAGATIERMAKEGDPKRFHFPRPLIRSGDFEFSFSGLKTAVLREVLKLNPAFSTRKSQAESLFSTSLQHERLPEQTIKDLARATQDAVIDVLTKKALQAVEEYNAKSLLLSGGVAANQTLQEKFKTLSADYGVNFFAPPRNLCTDNAGMIASAAYFYNKTIPWQQLIADPELYF